MKRKYCVFKYAINLWQQQHHLHTVSQISNADQTPVYFEMPHMTISKKDGIKKQQYIGADRKILLK
jgi:hypothetical protein